MVKRWTVKHYRLTVQLIAFNASNTFDMPNS